ncbi:MAG: extracellular solute-binding protein [Oscillospiraceae bacterium]|nr:extracellular solute-binding protein [Oscillospiraceae bacterium]
MKKNAFRIIAVILTIALGVSVLAGCRDNSSSNFVPPEYVFVPEIINLPAELQDVRNLTYFDDTLYFWSNVMLDRDTWQYEVRLYTMNTDGSNITQLTNYTTPKPPEPDAEGSFHIMALNVDNEGHIWLAEMGSFFRFDLPDDFDGEEWEKWEYAEHLGEIMGIRKLDGTGAEILTLDISALSAGVEWFYISAFNIDGQGNLYLGTNDGDIYVLNGEGQQQFKVNVDNWVDNLIRMPDGSVAFNGWMEGVDGYSMALRKIDVAARDWGETIELPSNAWNIYQGGGDYSVIFREGSNLFGLDTESGESVKILNWLESNIVGDNLDNVIMLEDGRIICTNSTWNRVTEEMNFELNILSRVRYADLPERTVITLSTIWLDHLIRNQIVNFNRTNPTYRIHVNDYSEFNNEDDWGAGLTRLSTDIIAGNIPDILDVSNLPFKQYVARDLLIDLYPLLDADTDIGREDLMEAVFRAAEMEGQLFRIFPSFYITSLVGHPDVVGPGMGWNWEEFTAVMNANPQADMPLGPWVTRENFLSSAIYVNIDEYVNWATGEVNFDTPSFIQLLEFSNRFPEDIDRGDGGFYMEESDMIASGRQIMASAYIGDFRTIQQYHYMFGGAIAYKGFPTESGNGNSLGIGSSLAITARSSQKDGAWEFMRGILSSDWQDENISWNFPTNKKSFDNQVQRALDDDSSHGISWGPGMEMELGRVTQADIDLIKSLIDSTFGIVSYDEALMNIINENTSDFFNGRSSAQDAARIIQSRVSIYVSEQS